MSFGVMGGPMQPQGHTQMMVRIADFGQNPQAAADAPRSRSVQGLQVGSEKEFHRRRSTARRHGHDLVPVDDYK